MKKNGVTIAHKNVLIWLAYLCEMRNSICGSLYR